MTYQDTSLWKRTLGKDDKNVEPLRESFLDARKNAEFLLDKIRKDFPNLTVHDITHVDSLWNVADTIIGKKYKINPLEGYILGVAFLIHDAALSYDAVGGKDKLRDTIEWKDAYADGPGDKDEEEFKKECDFAAIRTLHAKYAEDILNKKFERDNTTTFYIIDNDEYRTQFGDMIGKIAASHHWSIDEVESKLENQVNPVAGLPSDWEINEQKLACILRCADAGHIDNGRAPYGICNSLIVNGVSRDHWESQTRLGQVRENRKNPEQLLITSTRPFEKDNFAAWNVAYDAVKLFDEELKKSNELLKSEGLSFPHIGVTGAESKEALSEYIKTNGWQPCSFGVHTSNVKVLIENLGGSKLYGENNLLLVALRELVQNARDAIQARRTMDGRPEEGRITIRLEEEEGKRWIEVEDDGIGMSLDCIKNHLLDFGSSYWKSNMAKYENPGLWSKGFKSIGEFGIGFYSVFMVAKSVEVVTRRYNKGVDDAKRIEFPEGLTLSPILSEAKLSSSISTIVRFELKDEVDLEFLIEYEGFEINSISLSKILSIVVAGLDVDVYFELNDKAQRIHTNVSSPDFDKEEWLRSLLVNDHECISELSDKLEKIVDEKGNLRGWLLPPEGIISIFNDSSDEIVPCIKTIGGLLSELDLSRIYNGADGFMGYVDGIEDNISRNIMILDLPLKSCLQTWAKKKYTENHDDMLQSDSLSKGYHRLLGFCGLYDEVIQDNIRSFYSSYRVSYKDSDVGTVIGLLKIHEYLSVGVFDDNDHFRDSFMRRIKTVFDSMSNNEDYESYFEKVNISERLYLLIETIVQINGLPTSNFSEIVKKYCMFSQLHLFKDGNKRALGVWVNLLLDRRFHKMIDWRKVDEKSLMSMINKAYDGQLKYNFFRRMLHSREIIEVKQVNKKEKISNWEDEVSNYLEQFLSSNYLTEITSPIIEKY